MRLNPFGELDSDTAVSLARPFGLAVNKVARDGSQDNGWLQVNRQQQGSRHHLTLTAARLRHLTVR